MICFRFYGFHLGRSPTSSNANDYYGIHPFHGNSIIFWIKSGWIRKGPAILSTCVKRGRFFACKEGFLPQNCTKFGTVGLFRQTEHAKAVYELFFILSPRRPILTLLRKKQKQNAGGTSFQKIVPKRER